MRSIGAARPIECAHEGWTIPLRPALQAPQRIGTKHAADIQKGGGHSQSELRREPKGHVRNVKMALTAQFTNHLFAHVLLAERGLLLDAAISASIFGVRLMHF